MRPESQTSELGRRAATTSVVLTVLYVVVLLGLRGLLAFFGRRDLLALSDRHGAALRQQAEHTAYLQAQAWLRDGQNQLGQVLAGRNDLQAVGRKSLHFLAGYLGSAVGAVYVVDEDGRSRRIASYGLVTDQAAQKEQLAPGENLVAEAPDAVLLDMRLPGDSGLTVLQRLKDDPRTRHIPVHVVFVEDLADMLDVSRLRTGRLAVVRAPCDLATIVARVANAFRYGGGKPVQVRLAQDGDRRAGGDRPWHGDRPGAPRPDLRAVRGPEGAQQAPGLGLGLFIARQIVRAHGGRIELRSAPGAGLDVHDRAAGGRAGGGRGAVGRQGVNFPRGGAGASTAAVSSLQFLPRTSSVHPDTSRS